LVAIALYLLFMPTRFVSRAVTDEHYMRLALNLAKAGLGHTSPNPMVGAVIVDSGGNVVARGFHAKAGAPHAEINAIAKLTRGVDPKLCSLFVTLEPCSTSGRTPPCTDAIIRAGFKRVVVGATDPNPRHAGNGLKIIREAGIQVRAGVLGSECSYLNRAFNKWIVDGRPWLIAKLALTLDGQLKRPDTRWLSSSKSRAMVQDLRKEVDAILVGSGTVRDDDPKLTIRDPGWKRQPWRVVVGKSPSPQARVFNDAHRQKTIRFATRDWSEILPELGRRDILSVLVEGGGRVMGSLTDCDLIDEVRFFLTPAICAGAQRVAGVGALVEHRRVFDNLRYLRVQDDVLGIGIRLRD
jgi:diaminohydroxyphosphoribosylaminopyrimidine deaminase/5-amino-6-(5-phosphoribosylamino)uracil reductase